MAFEDRLAVFNRFVHKYSRLPTEFDSDFLEMLRMSKYNIVDVPITKPGNCANCGASKNDGRRYIDFGLELDWYGTVYLCGDCLKDVAHEMGVFKDLEMQLLESVVKDETVRKLQEQGDVLHEKAEQLFREFEEFYVGLHSTKLLDSNTDDSPSVDNSEVTSKSGTSSTQSGIKKSDPRTPKSPSSSGRQDIRSLAELLKDSG